MVEDGGGGSLGTGQVRVGGTDASLYTGLAASFEDQAAAHENYTSQTADWIQAPVAADGTHKHDYVTTAAVPEPATLPLLSIGLAGIAVWAYKRRTRAASSSPAAPRAARMVGGVEDPTNTSRRRCVAANRIASAATSGW